MALSTSSTVLVINLFHRGELKKPVPKWLERVAIGCLGRAMRIKYRRSTMNPIDIISPYNNNKYTYSCQSTQSDVSMFTPKSSLQVPIPLENINLDTASNIDNMCEPRKQVLSLLESAKELLEMQCHLVDTMNQREMVRQQHHAMCHEWRQIAVLSGRIFMLFFSLCYVSINVFIYFVYKNAHLTVWKPLSD